MLERYKPPDIITMSIFHGYYAIPNRSSGFTKTPTFMTNFVNRVFTWARGFESRWSDGEKRAFLYESNNDS